MYGDFINIIKNIKKGKLNFVIYVIVYYSVLFHHLIFNTHIHSFMQIKPYNEVILEQLSFT